MQCVYLRQAIKAPRGNDDLRSRALGAQIVSCGSRGDPQQGRSVALFSHYGLNARFAMDNIMSAECGEHGERLHCNVLFFCFVLSDLCWYNGFAVVVVAIVAQHCRFEVARKLLL